MAASDKWSHHTACHLDGAVMVTAIPDETKCLLTVRGKDHDLTADDCKALAATLREAAVRLRGDADKNATPALATPVVIRLDPDVVECLEEEANYSSDDINTLANTALRAHFSAEHGHDTEGGE